MRDLNLSILGFPAANRDLTVELRDPITQSVVRTVKPYLDGTVRVPKIDPGAYELTIKHPNLELPVVRRPIRVLPQGDTKVSVVIDPSKFRNTPIEDIPEANLGPILDTAKSVAETLAPLTAKVPGEVIRADDFNRMAGAIRDLAEAVAELTRRVSPTGHDHPELVKKFDEVTGNFQALLESVTSSITELQRDFQVQRFNDQVKEVLVEASVDPQSPRGKELTGIVAQLGEAAGKSPTDFNRAARNAGVQLATQIETLVNEKPELAEQPSTQHLSAAVDLLKQQRATTYQSELEQQRKTARQLKTFKPVKLG